jgi:hypothetical protein
MVGASTFALEGIDCPTTTVCFAVGGMQNSTAAVLYTTDGWATSTLKPSAGPNNLNRISCANVRTCLAVGDAGSTIRTTDGVNWSASAAPTTQHLQAVDCPSAAACFAVATTATQVFATTDGGATWSLQPSPSPSALWDVDCITPTTCLVTGGGGTIVSTTNGGASWTAQNSGTTSDLFGVDCPVAAACYAVGRAGIILRTPPLPPPLWWTQPGNPPAVAPPGPWYQNRLAPPPVSPPAMHSAPPPPSAQRPASPSGSPLRAAAQANASRALASFVEQIANKLQAIF